MNSHTTWFHFRRKDYYAGIQRIDLAMQNLRAASRAKKERARAEVESARDDLESLVRGR